MPPCVALIGNESLSDSGGHKLEISPFWRHCGLVQMVGVSQSKLRPPPTPPPRPICWRNTALFPGKPQFKGVGGCVLTHGKSFVLLHPTGLKLSSRHPLGPLAPGLPSPHYLWVFLLGSGESGLS